MGVAKVPSDDHLQQSPRTRAPPRPASVSRETLRSWASRTGSRPHDVKVVGADGSSTRKKNGAISLKCIRTLAQAVEHLVVNSRIPPPFANRPFGEQCLRW